MAITDDQKERINRAMPANRGVDLGGIIQQLQNAADDSASKVAENQADSTAADVGDLVADFNALLAKLKAAGLMEADPS